MTRPVPVQLTRPQIEALLSAINEIDAGETDHWPASDWRALMNARTKLLAAIH